MRSRCFQSCLPLVLSVVGLVSSTHGQPLDPLDFASLGTLNLPAGDYTIDTDTLTIFDNTAPGVPLFTGVVDDQNGQADTLNGVWDPVANPGQLGIPQIAVFTFDDIDLQLSTNVTIIGTRAIALLSQGNAVIATPLSVAGSVGVASSNASNTPITQPQGTAGSGGFAGGAVIDSTPSAGAGPGGGGAATPTNVFQPVSGGPGGFGGNGVLTTAGSIEFGEIGLAYGDLAIRLQGGSGGGALASTIPGFFVAAAGGGGGGAIEIGAAGLLTVNADIDASGGNGSADFTVFNNFFGGAGSGGGVRLHAQELELDAQINVRGGNTAQRTGGGGRVYLSGLNALGSAGIDAYIIGQPLPDTTQILTQIDVRPGGAGNTADSFGVITLSPRLTIVPVGQTHTLGQTIDLGASPETVEFLPRDLRVAAGGVVLLNADTINTADLELAGYSAVVREAPSTTPGSVTLTNRKLLSGTGRVETPVTNTATGRIAALDDELTFTRSVTNQVGGTISAIDSTLRFDAGLASDGQLNLINSTVGGDVVNNGVVALAGTNTFTGAVSGAGTFTGTGTAAFAGALSPGNSPGLVTFEGDLLLKSNATLEIEISGSTAGVDYDRIEVGGLATLQGTLDVTLLNGFVPNVGDSFAFLSGAFDASFAAINMPDLSAEGLAWELNPGGATLFLEAVPALDGDFNLDGTVDAADYTVWRDGLGTTFTTGDYDVWSANFGATAPASSISVPEPTAGFLLIIAVTAGQQRRRN